MQHDVVVIGAGPAEATAALLLRRAGCRAFLLKKERLGREKPWGGGPTSCVYRDLEAPLDELVEAQVDTVDLQLDGRFLASFRSQGASGAS